MLLLNAAHPPRGKRERQRIGLAIAGGGPIGAMWELGALRALEDSIVGLDLDTLDVYVGVSSGSFLAAGLANGISTVEMTRIFLTGDSADIPFRPEDFMRPAVLEYVKHAATLPRAFLEWVWAAARNPFDTRLSDVLLRMGSLLPTGMFDNDSVEGFLRRVLAKDGRTNDFRALQRKLYVVAVELDSGKAVRFGSPGLDHVPISRAVEASAALPGLYPPVKIGGRWYVDGALARTLHASAAFDEGVSLVLGVNPLVPFDADLAQAAGRRIPDTLARGGLPGVLSQTFRTLLTSRMQTGLSKYAHNYPRADMVLVEPHPDDVELFFTNIFSYTQRVRIAELAFRTTRHDLAARAAELTPLLARHGLALDMERLATARTLHASLPVYTGAARSAAALADALDELDSALRQRRTRGPRSRRPRRPKATPPRDEGSHAAG
ncbi:MAG: patatin-like phospholipase family protein [Mizugakiibacter sp.]|uniref:patatin-like phospholipase family protein n=1 Tax=Mizugakiibacter sp. TaxID=1972610 RepID=UPI0031C599DC|nr:patatin-like phospholipase family protein [Xanthomonadaceae bacterium]